MRVRPLLFTSNQTLLKLQRSIANKHKYWLSPFSRHYIAVIDGAVGLQALPGCKHGWSYNSNHKLCTHPKNNDDCGRLDQNSKAKDIGGTVLCTLAALNLGKWNIQIFQALILIIAFLHTLRAKIVHTISWENLFHGYINFV